MNLMAIASDSKNERVAGEEMIFLISCVLPELVLGMKYQEYDKIIVKELPYLKTKI